MRHSASVGGLLVGLTVGLTVAVTVALTGCSPALNWRDVRPEGSHAQLLFPCKPDVQERRVALAGPPVRLVLHVCSAADLTWAFAVADMAEPGRVGPALAALQAAAAANLGSAPGAITPQAVPGATPQPGSGRSHLRGQLSDGHGVQMQVLVFARGTQVFQASVLGAALPEEAVDTYFTSLRFPP
jgi:hypothetical protein